MPRSLCRLLLRQADPAPDHGVQQLQGSLCVVGSASLRRRR